MVRPKYARTSEIMVGPGGIRGAKNCSMLVLQNNRDTIYGHIFPDHVISHLPKKERVRFENKLDKEIIGYARVWRKNAAVRQPRINKLVSELKHNGWAGNKTAAKVPVPKLIRLGAQYLAKGGKVTAILYKGGTVDSSAFCGYPAGKFANQKLVKILKKAQKAGLINNLEIRGATDGIRVYRNGRVTEI